MCSFHIVVQSQQSTVYNSMQHLSSWTCDSSGLSPCWNYIMLKKLCIVWSRPGFLAYLVLLRMNYNSLLVKCFQVEERSCKIVIIKIIKNKRKKVGQNKCFKKIGNLNERFFFFILLTILRIFDSVSTCSWTISHKCLKIVMLLNFPYWFELWKTSMILVKLICL